jgi:hypothetical protein
VEAQYWATWHHVILPLTSKCQMMIHPFVIPSQCHCTYHIIQTSMWHTIVRSCHVILCHVSHLQWCHVSHPDSSTTTPTQINTNAPCHVSCMVIRPVQSTSMLALYRLYNQHFFFLFDETNRSRYISHTTSRLSLLKLCWVHIDEAYAHIRFEEIMSTFMFRPSWTPSWLLYPIWIK